jgi:hypothetical protein
MGFVNSDVMNDIEAIIKHFTPTIDGKQIAKCEIVKMVIKLVIELMLEAVSIGSSFVAGPMVGAAGKEGPKIMQALAKWIEKSGDKMVATHIKNIASLTKLAVTQVQKQKANGEKLQGLLASGDGTTGSWLGEYPGLGLHISKAKGMCGSGFSIPVGDVQAVDHFLIQVVHE